MSEEGTSGWRTLCLILAVLAFLAAEYFNVAYAIDLWGGLGGFLALTAFPVMAIVVPIALLQDGVIPLYWPLFLVSSVLWWYGQRNQDEEDEKRRGRNTEPDITPPASRQRSRQIRRTALRIFLAVIFAAFIGTLLSVFGVMLVGGQSPLEPWASGIGLIGGVILGAWVGWNRVGPLPDPDKVQATPHPGTPARSTQAPNVPAAAEADDPQPSRQRRVRLTTIGLSAGVVLLVLTLIGIVVIGIRDDGTQERTAQASTPIQVPSTPLATPASAPPSPSPSPSPTPTQAPTATPLPPTPSPAPTPSPPPVPSPTPLPATVLPATVPAGLPTPTALPSLRPSASPTVAVAPACTHDAGAWQAGRYVDVRSIRIAPTSQPPTGFWNVAGEFFNGCDVPICVSLKSVTHYDAQGRVVDVGTAVTPVIEVPPGGVRSFQFLAPFTAPGLWERSVLVFDEVPKSPRAPAFLCY